MGHGILESRIAIIHGAGGAIGGAIAGTFARQGATVFLAGRTRAKLEAVQTHIARAGGTAEVALVDALDERAVDAHADAVAARAGGIDVVVNAVGVMHVQGTPFLELSLEDYAHPLAAYARTNFITAKAAARHMVRAGRGVVLLLSTPGSRMAGTGFLGYGVTCAAVEALSRLLAAELGPSGVRVNCLRPHAIPEAAARGSHSGAVFRPAAERAGVTVEAMLAGAATTTLLRRLPTLDEVASAAAFLASDGASALTGTIANLSCGAVVD
jgi:NAD(P)-dependent dehydrogenase (short-subunit alcohol dehydrogenase family)